MKVLIQLDQAKPPNKNVSHIMFYEREPYVEVEMDIFPNVGDTVWLSDEIESKLDDLTKGHDEYGKYSGDCILVCDRIFDLRNNVHRLIISDWRNNQSFEEHFKY